MKDMNKSIRNQILDVKSDIDHTMLLISKYPYLSNELSKVVDELKIKLDKLEEAEKLEDDPNYNEPDYNRINKDEDDLSVIKSKIKAQKKYITEQ